jgi:hypothetical protein
MIFSLKGLVVPFAFAADASPGRDAASIPARAVFTVIGRRPGTGVEERRHELPRKAGSGIKSE